MRRGPGTLAPMARTRSRTRAAPHRELIARLTRAYGPSGWWPADSPFEVMVGAILVQNTAWTNVERAIANLRAAELLEPRALGQCRMVRLRRLVRPSGYFNQKADRLKRFARWIVSEFGGSVAAMRRVPLTHMREALLAQHGIGPETADSILCYALGHPVFVADAYTRRIFARHGVTPPDAKYHALQVSVMDTVPHDQGTFGELHGHLVTIGKNHCARRVPACAGCPLDGWHRHDPTT